MYVELFDRLHQLIDLQNQFAQILRKESQIIWTASSPVNLDDEKRGQFQPIEQASAQLEEVIRTLIALEYVGEQDGRATLKLKGAVGVTQPVLESAAEINLLKEHICELLHAIAQTLPKKRSINEYLERQSALREVLAHAGIPRLNLNQVRRMLPVVKQTPYRISFLAKRSPSCQQITIADAQQRLMALTSQQAAIDMLHLGQLKPGTPLVIVHPKNLPAMKANIFMRSGDKISNYQIHAPIPILFRAGAEVPKLHVGGFRSNTQRSDRVISETCFLPSISAHLYG